jgi:hypothetical protein
VDVAAAADVGGHANDKIALSAPAFVRTDIPEPDGTLSRGSKMRQSWRPHPALPQLAAPPHVSTAERTNTSSA